MKRYHAIVALAFLPLLALLLPKAAPLPETAAAPDRVVALTFDDGPHDGTTERLLDGLKERGIRATFFLIGEEIAGREALVRRMAAEGHQIGNHTYTHVRLDQSGAAGVREIERTDAALRELLGDGEYWVRPPWGIVDARTAAQIGVPLIYWSVDPEDWRVRDADAVTRTLLREIQSGDIVLLHDVYETSVDAALRVADALREQGYEFVTVKELFARAGAAPQAGTLYKRAGERK